MKKLKLFFACVFLCTATAFADILVNDENFPDENFRNWILQQSWGSDGVITDAEIAEITTIDVGWRGFRLNIADLTGINFFTNLDTLNVGSNQLTSLDVSALTNLKYLFASDNQLATLNVSGLTNLTSLNVGWNQLTSLDVSTLTNLTRLSAERNQLTSLDVSTLTNLTHLFVGFNQLTSLDVSGLTKLQYLSCSFNPPLTSLDVSNLPNLTVLWAETITQLTSLDVSNLPNLIGLFISGIRLTSLDVSGSPNLQFLRVNNSRLTSLDVSNLQNLALLYVAWNQLTSLDVSNLTNLQRLDVTGNQLTSLDVSNLTNLQSLFVSNNQLTSLDLTRLDNLTTFTFTGHHQTPTLTLTGADNNYSLAIELNNPTNLVAGLSFYNGILTSTDSTIASSPFSVETGITNWWFGDPIRLSGTLHLDYETRIVTPTENSVTIKWAQVEGAEYYELVIFADAGHTEKIAHAVIDAQQSRSGAQMLSYTVTGLSSATQFFYTLTAFNNADEVINISTGSFTTLAPVSIPEINLNRTPVAFYTITGVRLGQKPQSGIFIILYDDGSAEKVMR